MGNQETDLENGTDTVYIYKKAKNVMLPEGGTVKYSYVFNKETGKWVQAEESRMDDWKRTYHIAGQWNYDGNGNQVTLTVSDVDDNGQMRIFSYRSKPGRFIRCGFFAYIYFCIIKSSM